MPTVTPSSRQLLPRDERRAQILRAAAQAFSFQGFAGTSVDEVAKQAGITKLIVYRHFDSKADLYRAVLGSVADRLAEEWIAVRLDPHAQIPGIRALLAVAREMPDGFRLMFLHAAREQEFSDYVDQFRQLQEALVDRDAVPASIPEGIGRTWVIRMVARYAISSVLEWLDLGDPDDDDLFLHMAAAGLHSMIDAFAGDLAAD